MRRLTLLLPLLLSTTKILTVSASKIKMQALLQCNSLRHLSIREYHSNEALNASTMQQTDLHRNNVNVMKQQQQQQQHQPQNVKAKHLQAVLNKIEYHLSTLQTHFCNLLDDRRAIYRDDVILTRVYSQRVTLANLLLRLPDAIRSITLSQTQQQQQQQKQLNAHKVQQHNFCYASQPPLTRKVINQIKATWLQHYALYTLQAGNLQSTNDVEVQGKSNTRISKQGVLSKVNRKKTLQQMYTLILSSALITCDTDIRIVLSDIQQHDNVDELVFTSEMYSAILVSLLSCCCLNNVSANNNNNNMNNGTQSVQQVDRAQVGDLAGYYFGHAARMMKKHYTINHYKSIQQKNNFVKNCESDSRQIPQAYMQQKMQMNKIWSALFIICAVCQVAPSLMDLWWRQFIEHNSSRVNTFTSSSTFVSCSDSNNDSNSDKYSNRTNQVLPFSAVHAALSWAAAQRDVERALIFLNTAKMHGITAITNVNSNNHHLQYHQHYHTQRESSRNGNNNNKSITIAPHALLTYSSDHMVQSYQLRLLAKLAATAKNLQMDGGLRQIAVQDIKRLISPQTLHFTPWPVINDILSSLSLPSAMQLIKFRSTQIGKLHLQTQKATKRQEQWLFHQDGNTSTFRSESNDIPFYIWASLLRRCAREHHIDEAQVLFAFIRKQSTLEAQAKRQLVQIMMRMYATLPVPDYASTMQLFVSHVVHHPQHEPVIRPDLTLCQLLLRAADSRNACMMNFLQGCADGVGFDHTTFELLLNAHPFKTMASLTQKLPHDYPASSLDAQLRLPANVDAHLRREEALRARSKPLYDSTGDVG